MKLLDIDNDGDNDLVIDSMIWTAQGQDAAGIVQFLANDGEGNFVDVTETTLYNFNLGNSGSHDPRYLDINQDGFVDILKVEAGYGEIVGRRHQTVTNTWANELLINTGTGKFVSAFRDGFHSLTLRQENILSEYGYQFRNYSLFDNRYYPYLLKNGRLGFVTFQAFQSFLVAGSPLDQFWFDVRATQKLFTGPHGQDTASRHAPGYSEYFYLTEYPDVLGLIDQGRYSNGLEHYQQEGRAEGRSTFAPGAHVHGHDAIDVITLREGDEWAFGYGGNDLFTGHAGNDVLDGGNGFDTAVFLGPRNSYELQIEHDTLTLTALDTVEGTDTLNNIEALRFTDQVVCLSCPSNGQRDEPITDFSDRRHRSSR